MRIGWLTCIPAVLLPHSPCRSTTANAPANRQMPIASVVTSNPKKKEKRLRKRIENRKRQQKNNEKKISDLHFIFTDFIKQ